ncbi:MAG: T9SS type A sorting domain-containing protein [Cyclobacteriaceae bacterium]
MKKLVVVLSILFLIFQCKEKKVVFCEQAIICDFALYPNPADSLVNISFKSNAAQEGSLAVFNLYGQQEIIQSFEILSGENENQLDLIDLSEGSYILRFMSEADTITSRLLKKSE